MCIGSTMIDTSIKNKLQQIENRMMRHKMEINPSEVTKILKRELKILVKRQKSQKLVRYQWVMVLLNLWFRQCSSGRDGRIFRWLKRDGFKFRK